MRNQRNLIVTVIVGVAAILSFLALRGVHIPPQGTEGAIGAAKRYASPQIREHDVTLTDPQIQAFVQSDAFHKLATDKEFQKVALSADYQKLMVLDAFK